MSDESYIVKPNGSSPRNPVSAMSSARFRHATALAINQHAEAIADLSAQLKATREFMADLSVRIDVLVEQIAELATKGE